VAAILKAAAIYLHRDGKGPGTMRLASAAKAYLDGVTKATMGMGARTVFERAILPGRVPGPKQSLALLRKWCKEVVMELAEYLKSPQPGGRAAREETIRVMAELAVRFAPQIVPSLQHAPEAAQEYLEQRLHEKLPTDADELLKWTLEAFGQSRGWIHDRLAGDRQAKSRAERKKRGRS
jgi:hypothetical protein